MNVNQVNNRLADTVNGILSSKYSSLCSTVAEADRHKPISTLSLINKVNQLHFAGKSVTVHLVYPESDQPVLLSIFPQPCFSQELECIWENPPVDLNLINASEFLGISFRDSRHLFSVFIKPSRLTEKKVCFDLSQASTQVIDITEKTEAVRVIVSGNNQEISGHLTSLIDSRLKMELSGFENITTTKLASDKRFRIKIVGKDDLYFSGQCEIQRVDNDKQLEIDLITDPEFRFPPREFRSLRREIYPAPVLEFIHPFTGKIATMQIVNLSGSGLAAIGEDIRVPSGFIFPSLKLYFANNYKTVLKGQISYQTAASEQGSSAYPMKYGIRIVDMTPVSHSIYLTLLKFAEGRCPSLGENQVDMDNLWEFFFESGFIYPKKYLYLESKKDEVREIYHKLYQHHPGICRHFIAQSNEGIMGHVSMLRFYNKSWMLYHHASREARKMAGVAVLKDAEDFIIDSFHIKSMNMDYIICYYRPDNKFPRHVMGRLADRSERKACSEDQFDYFMYRSSEVLNPELPKYWQLEPASSATLSALEHYYESTSGGLMIDALDMKPDQTDLQELSYQYMQAGFNKEMLFFELKYDNWVKAVLVINLSNPCLNMSGLTHCIKLFLIDDTDVSTEILKNALSLVMNRLNQPEMPILLFQDDRQFNLFSSSKRYSLWILSLKYADDFCRHLHSSIFRLAKAETVASVITI